jgi:predicted small lipoprotein YifL
MKKAILSVLIMVIVLACVSLAACAEGGVLPPSEETTPPPSDGGTTPPPSGGVCFTWYDMPTYPGVTHVARENWAAPPGQGEWQPDEWSRVEWRHYATSDSQSKVVEFYKSEMPQSGWQQVMEVEVGEVNWFLYTKNNGQDGAMVWLGKDDGRTAISLMRSQK